MVVESETAAVVATGRAAAAGSTRRRMCFAACCATTTAEPCSTYDDEEIEAEAGASAMHVSGATDLTSARASNRREHTCACICRPLLVAGVGLSGSTGASQVDAIANADAAGREVARLAEATPTAQAPADAPGVASGMAIEHVAALDDPGV